MWFKFTEFTDATTCWHELSGHIGCSRIKLTRPISNTPYKLLQFELPGIAFRSGLLKSACLLFVCFHRYWDKILSVCMSSSATLVYCDKPAEARIMQFSLKCSTMHCIFSLPSLITKFEGGPLERGGSICGGVDFDRVRDAISRKRCEIELRRQLITNRK